MTTSTTPPEVAADGAPRGQAVLDALVGLLDLEQLEVNLFRGVSPPQSPTRVFGGQVAAQALVAAGRTVPDDRGVHSLHAYFIRPGDPRVPIVYEAERVRDGRSFTTRRVLAIQHGEAIFSLSASFQVQEEGLEHTEPGPVGVPAPDMQITLPLIEVFGRGGATKSSWYGDCLPSRDFPMLADLYRQGRFPLADFVTETIGIDDVDAAFDKMRSGDVLRSVVVFT